MTLTSALTITPLATTEDAQAFAALNTQWIAEYFGVEEEDRRVMDDPQGQIIDAGGQVLIARLGEEIVGCVALLREEGHPLEIGKMVVAPELRGRGLGRAIMVAAIEHARALGDTTVFLASSTRLAPAIALYESLGFTHLTREEAGEFRYARADVFMSLTL